MDTTTKEKTKPQRNSSLEVLRILSILMIIFSHIGVHGLGGQVDGANQMIPLIFSVFGNIGVNVFVMISAWFMVNKEFKLNKLVKLFGQVWFYSIGSLLLFHFVIAPSDPIPTTTLLRSICPILYDCYWFITCYVLLMLVSKYINKFMSTSDKKTHLAATITLFTMTITAGILPKSLPYINRFIWFVAIYLVIGYIKKYRANMQTSGNLLRFFIYTSIGVASVFLMTSLGELLGLDILKNFANFFVKYPNSILLFLSSIELFLFFAKMRPFSNKIINLVSASTLGIYLLHDNFLLRTYLWVNIFQIKDLAGSALFPICALAITIVVFIGSMLVDIIRSQTIEKIWLKISLPIYTKIVNLITKQKGPIKRLVNHLISF